MNDLQHARAFFTMLRAQRNKPLSHPRDFPQCWCGPEDTITIENVAYCRSTFKPVHRCTHKTTECTHVVESDSHLVCAFTGFVFGPLYDVVPETEVDWLNADRMNVFETTQSEDIKNTRPISPASASTLVCTAPGAPERSFDTHNAINVTTDILTNIVRAHTTKPPSRDATAWIRLVAREAVFWWFQMDVDSRSPDFPRTPGSYLRVNQLTCALAILFRGNRFVTDTLAHHYELGRLAPAAQTFFPAPVALGKYAPDVGTCTAHIGRFLNYVRWRRRL